MNINYDALDFSPLVRSETVKKLISKMATIYSDTNDNLRMAKLNEVLLQLMIEIIEKYSKPKFVVLQKSKKFNVVKETIMYVQKNFNRRLTLDEISEAVHFDKYTLCKEFKRYTGQTVVEYLHKYRSIKAIEYLEKGFTVAETAYMCGFENLSFFTKIFKRCTGKLPSYYKK